MTKTYCDLCGADITDVGKATYTIIRKLDEGKKLFVRITHIVEDGAGHQEDSDICETCLKIRIAKTDRCQELETIISSDTKLAREILLRVLGRGSLTDQIKKDIGGCTNLTATRLGIAISCLCRCIGYSYQSCFNAGKAKGLVQTHILCKKNVDPNGEELHSNQKGCSGYGLCFEKVSSLFIKQQSGFSC